jgi:hypothetical protein
MARLNYLHLPVWVTGSSLALFENFLLGVDYKVTLILYEGIKYSGIYVNPEVFCLNPFLPPLRTPPQNMNVRFRGVCLTQLFQ